MSASMRSSATGFLVSRLVVRSTAAAASGSKAKETWSRLGDRKLAEHLQCALPPASDAGIGRVAR
jgi:hypothetical protein